MKVPSRLILGITGFLVRMIVRHDRGYIGFKAWWYEAR